MQGAARIVRRLCQQTLKVFGRVLPASLRHGDREIRLAREVVVEACGLDANLRRQIDMQANLEGASHEHNSSTILHLAALLESVSTVRDLRPVV